MQPQEFKDTKILIVDDMHVNIKLIKNILKNEGHIFESTTDPREAISIAKEFIPDLILLDIEMPHVSGIELCQKFREERLFKDTSILFITSHGEDQIIGKAFEAGGDDFIFRPKNFKTLEVIHRVRTALRMKKHEKTIVNQLEEVKGLIRVICHDIATPLTVLNNAIEKIREKCSHEQSDDRKTHEDVLGVVETSYGQLVKYHLDLQDAITLTNNYQDIDLDSLEDHPSLYYLMQDFENTLSEIKKSFVVTNGDDSNLKQWLDLATKNYNRVFDILCHVRLVRSLAEKKKQIPLSKINLGDILKDSLNTFLLKIKEKEIKIIMHNDNSYEQFVMAERVSLLNSVINNIILNAIKFCYKDGVIEIGVSDLEGKVELMIKDNGIGINKKLVEEIFSSTVCTSHVGTCGEKGTGFGMPIAKQYMSLYGGRIRVESISEDDDKENHGTTFYLTFLKE